MLIDFAKANGFEGSLAACSDFVPIAYSVLIRHCALNSLGFNVRILVLYFTAGFQGFSPNSLTK